MVNIIDKSKCCGCSACVQKCPKQSISMQIDDEGFYYPHVNHTTCVDCGLCEKVCPELQESSSRLPLECYAAKGKDINIVKTSSSAGVFSLLAEKTIRKGGVVFGARFSNLWDVEHSYTNNLDGIKQFRSSKYVQSRIGKSYQEVERFLKDGREVLFTGTPCQILGLRTYLRKDYDNLTCVDVICHGTPSPGVWRDYLRYIISPKRRKNTVSSPIYSSLSEDDALLIKGINFRNKRLGWKKYSFVVLSSQGKCRSEENTVSQSYKPIVQEKHYFNMFFKVFLDNIILRQSCYSCPARKGRSGSDILLGDYWGINRYYPEFFSPDGVSMALAYTDKGVALLKSLDLDIIDFQYEQTCGNANIEYDEQKPNCRAEFFANYKNQGFSTVIQYFKDKDTHPFRTAVSKIIDQITIFFS